MKYLFTLFTGLIALVVGFVTWFWVFGLVWHLSVFAPSFWIEALLPFSMCFIVAVFLVHFTHSHWIKVAITLGLPAIFMTPLMFFCYNGDGNSPWMFVIAGIVLVVSMAGGLLGSREGSKSLPGLAKGRL